MTQIESLNKRKNELFNEQERILNAAAEAKRSLTAAEEEQLTKHENEVKDIEKNVKRLEAIAIGKSQLQKPVDQPVVNDGSKPSAKKTFSPEYREQFWSSLQHGFRNAALGEGGTTDGGYLVPITVDATIVPLAPQENVMRQLALVIPTTHDIKLPAQLTKTLAAAKAESRSSDNPFAGTAPSFTQVTLTAYMSGVVVPVTLELAQDVPALEPFLTADMSRGIVNYEEDKFVNGTGSGEPEGILNADAAGVGTGAWDGENSLDVVGSLRAAYYPNASWLMNRLTGIAIRKKQLSDNQFNPYFVSVGRQDYLHGFPILYSSAMPVYSASPSVEGKVAFGDFKTCMTIGDRGGPGIAVKVLDQTSIKNGVLDVLGYRRSDSRIRVSEAVKIYSITS